MLYNCHVLLSFVLYIFLIFSIVLLFSCRIVYNLRLRCIIKHITVPRLMVYGHSLIQVIVVVISLTLYISVMFLTIFRPASRVCVREPRPRDGARGAGTTPDVRWLQTAWHVRHGFPGTWPSPGGPDPLPHGGRCAVKLSRLRREVLIVSYCKVWSHPTCKYHNTT